MGPYNQHGPISFGNSIFITVLQWTFNQWRLLPEPYSDNDSDFNCSEANKKLIVLFGHLLRLQNDAFNSHEFIVKTNDLTHQLWVKTVYKKFKSFIELQQPRKPWQIFLRTLSFRLSNKDYLIDSLKLEITSIFSFDSGKIEIVNPVTLFAYFLGARIHILCVFGLKHADQGK